MAGHMARHYFERVGGFDVLSTSRDRSDASTIYLNVTKEGELEELIMRTGPDVVINGTGLLNDVAEKRHDEAIRVNGLLPHRLAGLAEVFGYKFVHISTDCVFSGARGGYTEEDRPDGCTWYARTKALGEVNNAGSLTFRTSIIGPELKTDGIGLFEWFMKQRGTIPGYANVFWTGVTTLELAKAIHAAILQDLSGLYHLVPPEKISKFELLSLIRTVYGKEDVEIVESPEPRIDKSLICTRTDFRYRVPDYGTMLQELRDWTS
ncbi:dTDP-4-dehydrorhamnose reductase family protein [Cohnella kolymensis]|uniref:dTDP-4-dehydrorhamnose reductase family protein n=1 Tax=Cohnella kolymensis TaxID=1590652 RepID=UPI000A84694C